MLSPNRRGLSRRLPVDRLDGRERVRFGRGLVAAIALDAREPESEAARILGARLDVVERDLGNDLRAHVDRVVVAPDLELEERPGLPGEHRVGEALEGLAEHDEATALAIPRAEVQIAQRSS